MGTEFNAGQFNADELVRIAMNESSVHRQITFAVRHLRAAVDSAARIAAKGNADWHDDPEGDPEGHELHHRTPDEQYPAAVRDDAAQELFEHYLGELFRIPHATTKNQ